MTTASGLQIADSKVGTGVAVRAGTPMPWQPGTREPLVELTAYDSSGRVVWSGKSRGGYFGWVSPTHPNH